VNRDPLDAPGAREPGVSALLGQLTSAATADELAGEQAALAMFRAVRAAGRPVGTEPAVPVTRRTRPARRVRVGARLAAAATVVALAGGFAAAGYAAALPAPLQRVAHQILGFAGVPASPDLHHGSPAPKQDQAPGSQPAPSPHRHSASAPPPASPSASPTPTRARLKSPTPRPSPSASRSGSPTPSPTPGQVGQLAISAADQTVTAGDSVQLTATLTSHGQPTPGASLRLLEHAAGQPGWRQVAQASTDQQGQAAFTVPDQRLNASFQLIAPDRTRSARLRIVVIPPLSVSVQPGPRHRLDLLIAACPLAQRGDLLVLEARTPAGQWLAVRTRRLRKSGQAAFPVALRKVSITYQVVLLATSKHGQSVSNQVTVAARTHPAR
jgi:hypothetical protein